MEATRGAPPASLPPRTTSMTVRTSSPVIRPWLRSTERSCWKTRSVWLTASSVPSIVTMSPRATRRTPRASRISRRNWSRLPNRRIASSRLSRVRLRETVSVSAIRLFQQVRRSFQPQGRHRRGEQQRVDDIKDTAKPGDGSRSILGLTVALDQRLSEIAENPRQPNCESERDGAGSSIGNDRGKCVETNRREHGSEHAPDKPLPRLLGAE